MEIKIRIAQTNGKEGRGLFGESIGWGRCSASFNVDQFWCTVTVSAVD